MHEVRLGPAAARSREIGDAVPVISESFVQDGYAESLEYREVLEVRDQLLEHLNTAECQALIAEVNLPGASSALVQATFLPRAREIGFRDEAKGLFVGYDNKYVRPDYFRPVGATGIILEVERGKTTINNMDFLDFWKCHLCDHANYLFLLVPRELRQNEKMSPRREFQAVRNHMASFFVPRNYTNVHGLTVFGY